MAKNTLEQKAQSAAYHALKKQGYVAPVDVLLGMGILRQKDYEDWRRGRIPFLERVMVANLSKISRALGAFRTWSREQGLFPSETVYRRWGKGPKRDLRFSKSGTPHIEKSYRTHFVSPPGKVEVKSSPGGPGQVKKPFLS